jgi:hypothetical protein
LQIKTFNGFRESDPDQLEIFIITLTDSNRVVFECEDASYVVEQFKLRVSAGRC